MDREHDRTAIWLSLTEALLTELRAPRPPTLAGLLATLAHVQFALRRWPWEGRSRREVTPSRWLIDDEADVQALLWAILAPAYGPDLVDETYLPHTGQVQPRADLAILSLRLIIEVKFLRTPADFRWPPCSRERRQSARLSKKGSGTEGLRDLTNIEERRR